ncbi:MAG: efflux pump, RND family, membrane fusion protein [Deltaproteobacteria bacterium]|nr:efflux pump, RND family, membrane fusion protein [Deltaproteobacteria bacterium]
MWNTTNLFSLVVAAMLFVLPACGDKGKAEPEKKEAAKTEKKEAGKGKDHKDRVVLSPEATKNAGIKVITLKAESLAETIRATANIAHNQDRSFHVTPRVRGRVVEVYASIGSAVSVGSSLALLDSTELGEARAEHAKAVALLDLAKSNVEREKRLFEQKISPQKDLLAAQAEERRAEVEVRMLHEKLRLYGLSDGEINGSNAAPSRYMVRAPGPGVVLEKEITLGEVIEAGKKVFTISDLSAVWVLLNIYEKDLAKVTRGTSVKIQTESYPGEIFAGKVAYIGDVLDPQNRTVSLRVEVPNPNRRLKPGMFATAEVIICGTSAKAIVIPSSAIQKIEGKPVAFVRQSDGSFAKKELQLGKEMSGKVEVKSGLTEVDAVVTEGSFTLKSELLKETLAEE